MSAVGYYDLHVSFQRKLQKCISRSESDSIFSSSSSSSSSSFLCCIFPSYATVGCVLFDPIENDEIQYNYLNFDTVIHAMMMLFVVGTGSEWTDFVADLWEAAPDGMPIFLWDLIVTFYFISYLILLYFLFLNIFIMVCPSLLLCAF